MVTDNDPGKATEPGFSHPVRLVPELVARQAARRPGATAVIAGDARLTYGELDPSLPTARLARACAQARPLAVLTAGADTRIPGASLLGPDALAAGLARQPATPPVASPHPDHLGYVIGTSGTSGQPKAVAVSHGSLACVIAEVSGAYRIRPQDRVLQLAPAAVDTSVEQVLVALTRGATVMLPPAGIVAPADLLGYLERERVTVADLTPAYWHRLLAAAEPGDRRLRSLRLMITGGEPADPADCRAALAAAPGARLLNAYGLTETTITSALFDVSAHPEVLASDGPVPVGRAAGHARIMVLDENLAPVPAGTAGEIWIGGCGVARGYLGDAGLTAARFVPGRDEDRMYRTGDVGRWRADGQLEVSGRIDRQLKVNGFRVDPGESRARWPVTPASAR